jgi:hypothetical protein
MEAKSVIVAIYRLIYALRLKIVVLYYLPTSYVVTKTRNHLKG